VKKSIALTVVTVTLVLCAIGLAVVLWTYPSLIPSGIKKSTDVESQVPAKNGQENKDNTPSKNEQDGQKPDESKASNGQSPGEQQEKEIDTSKIGIAGISLGDSKDKVKEYLGDDYKEIYQEEGGYFGEAYYVWDYSNKGITFIIGKDSGKVLEIELTGGELSTNMGDKVGDTAKDILEKYRAKYKEPTSIHTNEKLEGWFDLGDTLLIIFDFDKDDGSLVNGKIQPDSKVEMIKLTSSMFLD
jgi:hypothetical protein